MQSALRSTTRHAVGISSRRGVAATTTTTKAAAATASVPERDWVAEKAWVTALVQQEVRAQMLAEEERRIARDRMRRASAEEWRRLADEMELWTGYYYCCLLGAAAAPVAGARLAILLFGR